MVVEWLARKLPGQLCMERAMRFLPTRFLRGAAVFGLAAWWVGCSAAVKEEQPSQEKSASQALLYAGPNQTGKTFAKLFVVGGTVVEGGYHDGTREPVDFTSLSLSELRQWKTTKHNVRLNAEVRALCILGSVALPSAIFADVHDLRGVEGPRKHVGMALGQVDPRRSLYKLVVLMQGGSDIHPAGSLYLSQITLWALLKSAHAQNKLKTCDDVSTAHQARHYFHHQQ